ncbi:MAG: PAS domain S-box protein [Calditrichia bacterium]|nr:PAS domain S-box protein [Calditrichia bacterium]
MENFSIKYKLIFIILFVTIFAILIGFSIIILNDLKTFKQDLVKTISTSATLTGRYCITAIAFNDAAGAEESLEILQTAPSISAGVIYDKYGSIFAEHKKDASINDIPEIIENFDNVHLNEFRNNYLHIMQPIVYKNQNYGAIYVIASTAILQDKINNYLLTMSLLAIIIIFISYTIATKIQNLISGPILKLANTAQTISESGDYSIRVKKVGNDEIAALYNGFNTMLEQIHLKQQERNKAEQEVKKNEAALQSIFKASPVGIGMVINRKLIRINDTLCNMTGYSNKELENQDIRLIYANEEEYNRIGHKSYKEIEVKGFNVTETYWKCKNGKIIDIQLNASSIDQSDFSKGITFTALDITERKKIEEKRKLSLERFKKQQEAISVLSSRQIAEDFQEDIFYQQVTEICSNALNADRVKVWLFDKNKENLKCVNAFNRSTNTHSRGEEFYVKKYPEYLKALFKGKPIDANNARTDYRTNESLKDYLEPNNIYSILDIIIRSSGKDIGIISAATIGKKYNWQNDEKTFIHSLADQIALVITSNEQKKTLKELNKAQNYISNIINSMPSVLVGVDTKGAVTHWNTEAEKTTGIKAKYAVGQLVEELLPQFSNQMKKMKQAISDKKSQKEEKIALHIDGKTEYSDLTIYPLIANGVNGAVIRIDNVTDSVYFEEMMIQSEKMMSVGGLAAGMAHEINNPLAGILQNMQVVRNRLNNVLPQNKSVADECSISLENLNDYLDKRDIWSMMESIMKSGQRAAKIVDNMLSFSRKSDFSFNEHDLCALMDNTLELASNDYDLKKKYDFRQIEIAREYQPNAPNVYCENSKIQQVFLNLLKNGAQAMADDKEKREKKKEKPKFIIKIYSKNQLLNIEIKDNGPGMDEQTRKRVFEPFFTTKQVGTGTGLGLSVSYFIITKNHKGTMSVESSPGNGTNFIIRLPLTQHNNSKISGA